MEPYTKKYTPKTPKGVMGQDKAISSMKEFLAQKKKKCAILYGPSGSGNPECSIRECRRPVRGDPGAHREVVGGTQITSSWPRDLVAC